MQRCATTLNSLCCQASVVASLDLITSTMPCDSARADPAGAGVLVEHAVSGRHSRFAPHAFATQEAICVFSGSLINSTGKPHASLCTGCSTALSKGAVQQAQHQLSSPARQAAALQKSSSSASRCLPLFCELASSGLAHSNSSSLTTQGVHHGFVACSVLVLASCWLVNLI